MFYSKSTHGFYDQKINGNNIPQDAVEITDSEYLALLAGQSSGKRIEMGDDGKPGLLSPSPPTPAERRSTAKTAIDTAAGNVRKAFVSTGQLIEAEYRLAQQQAQAWRANGSPADNVPPAISDWATTAGFTNEEAASAIETAAVQLEGVLIAVRNIRLQGKAAVDAAADTADFNAIAQPYIDQLEALKPA